MLRDARTFTVDDPRFSTAKVVGPSMLSLDGSPLRPAPRPVQPLHPGYDDVNARLACFTQAEAARLVSAIEPRGAAELRRAVAGPLAVAVMAEVARARPGRSSAEVLAWYDGIVAAVQAEAATGRRAAAARSGSGRDGGVRRAGRPPA